MNSERDHNRKYVRLPGFDYALAGAYFITICVKARRNLLGELKNGIVGLSNAGSIVAEEWQGLPTRLTSVCTDEFAIMPNHIHGILWLLPEEEGAINRPLPEVLRAFKACTTIMIRRATPSLNFAWQRNYYEHILRNDEDLVHHRQYILNNPAQWELDKENILP